MMPAKAEANSIGIIGYAVQSLRFPVGESPTQRRVAPVGSSRSGGGTCRRKGRKQIGD